jgi:branched-chain amino acid transport system ATP-binding protein
MTTMLNVRDLRAYYGQVQALHGLEFGLNEGSLTTLLGANGAGKTTTLRAICNMVRTTGSIEFEGAPLAGRSTFSSAPSRARTGPGSCPTSSACTTISRC